VGVADRDVRHRQVRVLRLRGFAAYDADEDGFSQPRADGRWGWRADRVAERLRTRSGNRYGQDPAELCQILSDLVKIEPLQRRSADLVLTATGPTAEIADVLLGRIAELHRARA
jgi:hypothetical protein